MIQVSFGFANFIDDQSCERMAGVAVSVKNIHTALQSTSQVFLVRIWMLSALLLFEESCLFSQLIAA